LPVGDPNQIQDVPGCLPVESAMDILRVETIAGFDRREWDALVGENVFSSHAWLRTLEETLIVPSRRTYFAVRDSFGLVAAAACYVQEPGEPSLSLDDFLFGRFSSVARFLRLQTLPALMCGARFGVSDPIFVRDGMEATQRQRLAAGLLQAMEDDARKNHWSLCIRGLPDAPTPCAPVFSRRRYLPIRQPPTALLTIEWDSFEQYRQHLKQSHKHAEDCLRKEMNRAKRTGVAIRELDDPAPHQTQLHQLLDAHYRRLNGQPLLFKPEFFTRLKANLGECAVVYVATVEGRLIGALVGLRSRDTMYLPLVGIDPERTRNNAAYFNLTFHYPIQDAIERRYRRIYYGSMLYQMKARRGCRLMDMHHYFRGRNTIQEAVLRPLFRYHSKRLDRETASLPRDRHPSPPGADGTHHTTAVSGVRWSS